MNWARWGKISREKEKGGLGIKNLKAFNLALLGKWKRRLLNEKKRLWVKILDVSTGQLGMGEARLINLARCGGEIYNLWTKRREAPRKIGLKLT